MHLIMPLEQGMYILMDIWKWGRGCVSLELTTVGSSPEKSSLVWDCFFIGRLFS